MLTEEKGASIEPQLSNSMDIRTTTLLSLEHYRSQTDIPQWVDIQNVDCIIKIEFYTQPEKHTLKLLSDICMDTKTQIHYLPDENCCYISPTKNTFSTLYSLTNYQ